ncbi:prepilin-type cleavage/methylation domain-containing protein [Massilia sp. UBA6681]|uniref:prepilin-type cleavage/methylation domain-containing protein n=1 Tax=Massilia sp. UBA6681 TaxID=1946839 RepID=UPI0025C69618|nr:prepilin-type cleavage/methylation domain-containing protein [Massilia sp. UBA6681]
MAGVTLVELIIAIVIVAAVVGGLASVLAGVTRASADPVVQRQMLAIAESMMEEVMLKPYAEGSGQGGRAQFDDIWDFNGYSAKPVTDIEGTPLPGLDRYAVSVSVDALEAGGLTGIGTAGDAARIRVTVRNGDDSLTLTGWRTRL